MFNSITLKNKKIINDITQLDNFDNLNKTYYTNYFKDNLLLKLLDNETILNEIKLKSHSYINNKEFIYYIEKYVKKYTPLDFKQNIFNIVYNNSIENNTDIDIEISIYYKNISNENIINIAYYTLVTYYVIKNYI